MSWTLDEGIAQVRALQPLTRQFNYHLAIGGSVANKGRSEKDLDLYFLPMDNGLPHNSAGLLKKLEGLFGGATTLGGEGYVDTPSAYRNKVQFNHGGRRIDVSIV